MIFNHHTLGVANIFSSSSDEYMEAPWVVEMFNAREEPRPPQPHHLVFLLPKFRPPILLDRRVPDAPSQRENFRYFQQEREVATLAALSRNPFYGEIMIDAESLEIVGEDDISGIPHHEMMQKEEPVAQTEILDIVVISAYLSLSLTGMIPYLVTVVTRGDEQDHRKDLLRISVAELTIVGNYLEPMSPNPPYNWIYHVEQQLCEELFRDTISNSQEHCTS